MIFIASSFAISIIMFLCFSILIAFMNHTLSLLRLYTPDILVQVVGNTVFLLASLKKDITAISGVDKVYRRMLYTNIPASGEHGSNIVTLVSYDEAQFE